MLLATAAVGTNLLRHSATCANTCGGRLSTQTLSDWCETPALSHNIYGDAMDYGLLEELNVAGVETMVRDSAGPRH